MGNVLNYANFHCYKCNTNNSGITPIAPCLATVPGVDMYSWSFTISFTGNTNIKIESKFGTSSNYNDYCRIGETYNMLQGKCVKFSCAYSYDVVGSKCIRRPFNDGKSVTKQLLKNAEFDSCLLSQEATLYIELSNSTNISRYRDVFQLEFNTTSEIFRTVLSSNSSIVTRKEGVTKEFFYRLNQTLFNSKSRLWIYANSHYVTSQKQQIITKLFEYDLSRSYSNNKVCADPQVITGDDKNFLSNCSVRISNRTIDRYFLSSWLSFKRNGINRKLSICNQFYLHSNCPLFVLKSNYSIIKNKSLMYKEGHREIIIPVENYLPLKHGIGICISKSSTIPSIYRWEWLKVVRDVEYYFSVIGTSISIVCYVCILTTFMLFKELRNIPGLNTMGMCCSLLTADIAFIITLNASKYVQFCKVMAVILHWSLMCVYSWVLIIAFDVASTFYKMLTVSHDRNTKIFLIYCLVASCVPTIFVIVTLTLNETKTVNFGYGDKGICWISSFKGRVVAYIVPVTFVFILSAIAISYTLYKVHKQNRQGLIILHKSRNDDINITKMALRLVFILGFAEIVGFIQIHNSSPSETEQIFNSSFALIYAFERSFRGIFLFYIYICNYKVYTIFKERLNFGKPQRDRSAIEMCFTNINCVQPAKDVKM